MQICLKFLYKIEHLKGLIIKKKQLIYLIGILGNGVNLLEHYSAINAKHDFHTLPLIKTERMVGICVRHPLL